MSVALIVQGVNVIFLLLGARYRTGSIKLIIYRLSPSKDDKIYDPVNRWICKFCYFLPFKLT